jgi:toxin ParE1/3/4
MANSQTRRPQAREDPLDIWQYIADATKQRRQHCCDASTARFRCWLINPQAGRERPELAPNLRSFPVGNYVIFYMPGSHGIEVVRVLNARQDIAAEDME